MCLVTLVGAAVNFYHGNADNNVFDDGSGSGSCQVVVVVVGSMEVGISSHSGLRSLTPWRPTSSRIPGTSDARPMRCELSRPPGQRFGRPSRRPR